MQNFDFLKIFNFETLTPIFRHIPTMPFFLLNLISLVGAKRSYLVFLKFQGTLENRKNKHAEKNKHHANKRESSCLFLPSSAKIVVV